MHIAWILNTKFKRIVEKDRPHRENIAISISHDFLKITIAIC